MTPAARVQAAIDILDEIATGKPAEQALTGWARRSRYAGSGDRAAIRDHVFDVLRARASLAVLGGGADGRRLMLGLLRDQGRDPDAVFSGARFAPAPLTAAERAALPDPATGLPPDVPGWLIPDLNRSLGDRMPAVVAALRRRAPVHLRANLRKTTVPDAAAALRKDGIETVPHPASETALEITEGQRKLRQSAAYLDGLVELQDAASQAVTDLLPLRPGQQVLDYCAGGGGKALAMAVHADVRVDAHDIAPERMKDIPVRAQRAGVSVRCLPTDRLAGPYDVVLCDAPCSGSGAWRRSPDAKWRLTPDRLAELTAIQDQVLDRGAALVRPGGTLAYATCSLLDAENRDRVQVFLSRTPGWSVVLDRHWRPDAGTDGFYTAHLTRQSIG